MPNIYTVITYSLPELKLLAPDVFERLHRKYRDHTPYRWSNPWASEYVNSLKAVMRAFSQWEASVLNDRVVSLPSSWKRKGRTLRQYIANRRYSYMELHIWGMNRIDPVRGLFSKDNNDSAWYAQLLKRRKYNKVWQQRDCPYTGMFVDEVLLKCATDLFLRGETIGYIESALNWEIELLDTADLEQACSEEEFLICHETSHYTIEGKEV